MKRTTTAFSPPTPAACRARQKVVELLLAEDKNPGARRAELQAAVREAVAYVVRQAGRMRHRHHQ